MSGAPGQLDATLVRTPFPGRPSAATVEAFRLSDPEEFGVMTSAVAASYAPVLLSPGELLEVLTVLIAAASAALPDHREIYVQLAMPATTRLPARLMALDVLLLVNAAGMYAAAANAGRNAILIEQDCRRFATEDGANRLRLRWTGGSGGREIRSRLADIAEGLGFRLGGEGEGA